MATLLDELSDLISALDASEIEYAVCGGLAAAIHGLASRPQDLADIARLENEAS